MTVLHSERGAQRIRGVKMCAPQLNTKCHTEEVHCVTDRRWSEADLQLRVIRHGRHPQQAVVIRIVNQIALLCSEQAPFGLCALHHELHK